VAVREGGISDLKRESDDFDPFFRDQYPRLVKHLVTLGFSDEEAKDAASEAMIEAYRRWDVINCPGAWVRVVARRVASRSAARYRDGLRRAAALETSAGVFRESDEQALFKEDQRVVLALLAGLPARQRVVMAWYIDGYESSEIAQFLRLQPATVRSHLRHARRRLAAAVAQAGIHPPPPEGASNDGR
jgi:RNA polymerase sigma factor (sigma-70 family)